MASSLEPTNVQVIAPATLSAGYTFEAMYENVIFDVIVPEGGVEKGQRFIVPFIPPPPNAISNDDTSGIHDEEVERDEMFSSMTVGSASLENARRNHDGQQNYQQQQNDDDKIPMGRWRDNLFDCFHYGCFHPSLWCACLFKPCLMGQLLTRMKMTWLGQRSDRLEEGFGFGGRNRSLDDSRIEVDDRWKKSYRNVVLITTLFFVVTTLLSSMEEEGVEYNAPEMKEGEDLDEYIERIVIDSINDSEKDMTPDSKKSFMSVINSFLSFLYGMYITYVIIQLRATMRRVYAIPEQSCTCWYSLMGSRRQRRNESVDGNVCADCEYISKRCCTADVPVGWEDICCSFFCQCCILGQMARHNVNYDERNALCCNDVGVANWDEDEAYYTGVRKPNSSVAGHGRVVDEDSALIV